MHGTTKLHIGQQPNKQAMEEDDASTHTRAWRRQTRRTAQADVLPVVELPFQEQWHQFPDGARAPVRGIWFLSMQEAEARYCVPARTRARPYARTRREDGDTAFRVRLGYATLLVYSALSSVGEPREELRETALGLIGGGALPQPDWWAALTTDVAHDSDEDGDEDVVIVATSQPQQPQQPQPQHTPPTVEQIRDASAYELFEQLMHATPARCRLLRSRLRLARNLPITELGDGAESAQLVAGLLGGKDAESVLQMQAVVRRFTSYHKWYVVQRQKEPAQVVVRTLRYATYMSTWLAQHATGVLPPWSVHGPVLLVAVMQSPPAAQKVRRETDPCIELPRQLRQLQRMDSRWRADARRARQSQRNIRALLDRADALSRDAVDDDDVHLPAADCGYSTDEMLEESARRRRQQARQQQLPL